MRSSEKLRIFIFRRPFVKWIQIQDKPTRSVGFTHDLLPKHPNLIISVHSWVEPTLRAAGSPVWRERAALRFARI
ncbi:hypothetical protein NEISICOT_02033 [Neisseria sicca ATCC 29256]|uniref:Uncharacterized protein n=1 Tax=Neisseria sicca ATCC 29256 TaxID=547045 RepID=C6M682_NEISI|nr:hypothetical protein NEISICOT_02033 [Neisseria sicca ATCC 29256]